MAPSPRISGAHWAAFVLATTACASSGTGGARDDAATPAHRANGGTGGAAEISEGGPRDATGAGGGTGGHLSGGKPSSGGSAGTPLPRDSCVEAGTCPTGVWTNVTPSSMSPTVLAPTTNAFGPGSVVGDPSRPSDLYVGGSAAGLWKSSDYGATWTQLNDTLPDVPRGVTIAVAGTNPATVWASAYQAIYKSTDGGHTFLQTPMSQSLYSLSLDPYDSNHLISGLHEADGVMESTDGGASWRMVGGSNFPTGGISWYPYFIDTGDPSTTRAAWFAIAQDGGSATITTDSGAHWTNPTGVNGLQHPHGTSNFFQTGSSLFVAGLSGPGQGVYRSTDLGSTWARVDSGSMPEAVVWGTPKSLYAMYAWACSDCNLGTNYETSPPSGTNWTKGTVPNDLTIGPNSIVVTYDGSHYVFVAVMWAEGIWRYVEP